MCGFNCGSLGPVSYTHLDVYKRQADNTTGLLTPLVKLDGETDGASVALVVTDPEGYAVYEGPAAGDTIEIEGIQPWSHAAPVRCV